MAGLSSAAVTRNFPALPNDLDMTFLNEAKAGLQDGLNKEWNEWLLDWYRRNNNKSLDDALREKMENKFKITRVKKILAKFKDGTIRSDLNCRENWWAAQLVLFELNGNKAIKEATA